MDLRSAVGGAAALVAAVLLLVGIVASARHRRRERPWLMVLFGINAGVGDVSKDTLRGFAGVDVVLLVLAAAAYAGFWPGPGLHQPLWMVLAIAQPLAGIPLLRITGEAGRSGLMGGALVLSVLMVVGGVSAAPGWLGVTASVLLLVGDFGTTGRRSRSLALVIALGYSALVAWFGWVSALLLT